MSSKRTNLTHRQRAGLPARMINALDLRQGARTERIPSRRRQDPSVRGGRHGLAVQLRREVDV